MSSSFSPLMLVLVSGFPILWMLLFVRRFPYTLDASFSQEFLIYSSGWLTWFSKGFLLYSWCSAVLVRSFSYTAGDSFSEVFLLNF